MDINKSNENNAFEVNLKKREVKLTPGSRDDVTTGTVVGSAIGYGVCGPAGAATGAAVGADVGYVLGTGNGGKNRVKW